MSYGYDVILWSIDTEDWAHTPPEVISNRVLSSLKDGDIILMHDYTAGNNTTCKALKILIPEILNRGYEFVTVSELISGAFD
jgi:peptidoglycan/xylan/chitin deacetylase (PgdA/CDA1 family)